ncbi:DUF6531 domain-containing protein, partial [Chitiniphilus shinanonensis]|uniref:DUF6531 domain-containing protein n=1 Tax=Chitiniphilus shinanonensis TaxID=553088 RepID=UPI0033429D59
MQDKKAAALVGACKGHPRGARPFTLLRPLIAALLLGGAGQAWAATCSVPNALIGSEITATDGPNTAGEFLYKLSPIKCSAGKVVDYDSSLGFPDAFEVGWVLPSQIENNGTLQSMRYNSRVFKNQCSTNLIVVHKNYTGTINDGAAGSPNVSLTVAAYPVRTAPYLDVFKQPLYLQHGPTVPPCLPDLPIPPQDKQTNACDAPNAGDWTPLFTAAGPAAPIRSQCGNPIAFNSGRKVQTEVDYLSAAGTGLSFSRSYNSQSSRIGADAGVLGNRWQHNHDFRLVYAQAQSKVYVRRGNGAVLHFTPKPGVADQWQGEADIVDTVKKLADGWEYTTADQTVERYNTDGRLLRRTFRNGQFLDYTNDATGRLTKVTDYVGRTLTLAYNAAGQLASVTTPSNHVISYGYTGGVLSSVTYPDNSNRQYRYVDRTVAGATVPTLLTEIIDESAFSYARWDYDTKAAASLSEHAGGVDRYTVTYGRDSSDKIISATVVDPLAATWVYNLTSVLGVNRPNGEARQYDNTSRTQTFDPQGNLAQVSDFKGIVTSYAYDLTRNLPLNATVAAGTPQARTITTTWHPTLRLPATITEPGRVTEFNYDPNGNLLSKKVTADGVSRTQSWSYLANGLLDTATDARGKVTRYTYDAQG